MEQALAATNQTDCRLAPFDIICAELWRRGAAPELTSGFVEASAQISGLAAILPELYLLPLGHPGNLAFIRYRRSHERKLADGRTLPAGKYRLPDLKERLLCCPHG